MQATDIMTTNVVTVGPDTGVDEIAQTLIKRSISAVPVVDGNGVMMGIVSEGDLWRRPENDTLRRRSIWLRMFTSDEEDARNYAKSHGMKASEVMTPNVTTVGEDTDVADIAHILEKQGIKRVPVLGSDGQLVGIVSRANLLHGLASRKTSLASDNAGDDRSIRRGILALLDEEGWVSHGALNVIVSDGAVELWGWVETEEERKALMIAARSIDGVKSVEDHLGMVAPWVQGA